VRRGDGFLFPQLGELGAGAALDEQRNKFPYPTVVESRVRALDGSRDLIRREMRILAGQSALDFGNQQLLADLGLWGNRVVVVVGQLGNRCAAYV
jgi:hypothetical protein